MGGYTCSSEPRTSWPAAFSKPASDPIPVPQIPMRWIFIGRPPHAPSFRHALRRARRELRRERLQLHREAGGEVAEQATVAQRLAARGVPHQPRHHACAAGIAAAALALLPERAPG